MEATFPPRIARDAAEALAGAEAVIIAVKANGFRTELQALVPHLAVGLAVIISAHCSVAALHLHRLLQARGVDIQPQAEIDIAIIDPIGRIETAYGEEIRAPHHHAGARDCAVVARKDCASPATSPTGSAGDKAFCAGQDLAESMTFTDASWVSEMESLFDQLRRYPKPVVAAGSGFQLALLCDIRIGWAGSRMGQTELNHDIPSIAGTWLMENEIGAELAAIPLDI